MQGHPLDGVRVLGFSQVVAGPYTTMLLGWLGAEVVKIESAHRPRTTPPHLADTLNCSKKSCSLDLTSQEGRDLAMQLVQCSDVVVENFSPRTMKRFGLDYPALRQVKPDLVMISMSAFGQTGPDRDYVGLAPGFMAYTGWMHMTGFPEGPPMIGGTVSYNDLVSGLYAVFAILSALHYRSSTGKGQYIDLAQAEVAATSVAEAVVEHTMTGKSPIRRGNRDNALAPHGCYRCKGEDNWVAIAVNTDEEWQAMCIVMGHPEWTSSDKFAASLSRWRNQEELDQLVQSWTSQRTHYEVMKLLQEAGVPAGPSLNAQELLNDIHLQERGAFVTTTKPGAPRRAMAGLPWKADGSAPMHHRAPLIGEDNEHLLGQLLGIPQVRIEQLARARVLY